MDACGVTSAGDNTQCVNTRNKALHKRLHLRKTAVEPTTMQSTDKGGPKKIAEEWERGPAWPSSKKSLQEAEQSQCSLRFRCSNCRDNLEYVPKDLVRHFEENHKGSPPVFSCHSCTFNTHEFSYLQVHLLSHTDTFSSCCICRDSVQRTWSELSTHLSARHCQNGKYVCETCPAFCTSNVQVFLEHMCVHNVHFEEADGDLSLHAKDKNPFGPKTTTQKLHCQHCDYEAAQQWLITKHIKAAHVCQSGNERRRRKKKEEVNSLAMKPNDPIPKMKPRLTRSAVSEMCWLTQDCLSLPGREFLDKYCHLSDPQTTLEETQQFLMKSVARETGDQKWTNALKTVLSNVPQDANLHPKSESGLMLNTDLAVLTVKNKITVAPNGGSYSKRLKRMTSSEREAVLPESAAADACCAVDKNGCQANLSAPALCAQAETKSHDDISALAPNEPFDCAQMQENRENQGLETLEEHGKHQDAADEGGSTLASELKLANEREAQPSVRRVPPRKKNWGQRWRRKSRYKKVDKASSALKIVLKKNPVKDKQWVSQGSLSTSGDHCKTPEKTMEVSQNASQTRSPKTKLPDTSGSLTSQWKPGVEVGPGCAPKPAGSDDPDGAETAAPQGSLSERREMRDGAETRPEPGSSVDDHTSEATAPAADGVTPLSSYIKRSPVSQLAVTSQGDLEDASLALSIEQRELPERLSSELVRTRPPAGKAIEQESSPASGPDWQPAPKSLERTLKLIAINPSQLVKRPSGGQPVVVLNHPDADIPEVARIMEVVHRYRGDVQKVVLSRRTLGALSATGGAAPKGDAPPASVQERFVLKMRLRRLSRKKYEVVGGASADEDAAPRFSCWFCGRVLESQKVWMVHRRRHLMESPQPKL
ncbi:zinc finger protein 518A [Betta splendens]|uniref:Zinc finger protein 518A n=1 Tax=Betta splendens TaxID=158456 RepID=A0A6P7KRJ1_BETSP|nr:zinc finger protein 518A [Betta splendens]XP_028983100.1 zinc finger protein 518A [Betta splendens]